MKTLKTAKLEMNHLVALLFCGLAHALQTPLVKSYPHNQYWTASPYPYLRPRYPDGSRHLYPCHHTDRATDTLLQCDSSPYQILFIPGWENQTHAKQKDNLIIIDIDQTILDSHFGSEGPVFNKHARFGESVTFKALEDKDLVLTLLQDPLPYSIVFRKHFFETLDYAQRETGFNADLVVYTRARQDYAQNIVTAINAYYNKNYRNHKRDDAAAPGMHDV